MSSKSEHTAVPRTIASSLILGLAIRLLTCVLLSVSLLLAVRRLLGELTTPLPTDMLLIGMFFYFVPIILVRCLTLYSCDSSQRPINLALSCSLILFAFAITLPGSNLIAIAAIWMAVVLWETMSRMVMDSSGISVSRLTLPEKNEEPNVKSATPPSRRDIR